jgi:hypothetical protein
MARAELGNLTVWYSPPSRLNVNCEIRAGSLFCTCPARIRPWGAAFWMGGNSFPSTSTTEARSSQDVHRAAPILACATTARQCKVRVSLS